ncbi:MAG: polysaccharide deacetylase family protein [Nitriliruptoraceae bacterium]
MPRHLVFRFDVDTHRCLSRGTPSLRDLADEFDVRFTFFVNMGRAVSRHRTLLAAGQHLFSKRAVEQPVQHLSSLRKLGAADTIRVIAGNPMVGAAQTAELKRLRDAGHEIGLHGGRNHRQWQDYARRWDQATVSAELAWGLAVLRRVIDVPVGFASPAWQQPDGLGVAAREAGIAYLADEHGNDTDGVNVTQGIPSVATNILGEPGGVGFLEWHRARRSDDETILRDFAHRLDRITNIAVMYDHPFWAGVEDLAMTAKLLREAQSQGVEVVTLRQAVDVAISNETVG